jgi:hypothetical protein
VQHKVLVKNHATYHKAEEASKELILYAVDNNTLAPLKKKYIGFGDKTMLEMIHHLCTKMAIKMMTAQKHEYRMKGYNTLWDPASSITAYFTQLNRFQISLVNRGMATNKAEKVMAVGAQMWDSKIFTEEQMLARENKPVIDQTWTSLQMYFTKKWLEHKQYLAMLAKQSCFKEAALATQEKEAAEVEGKT